MNKEENKKVATLCVLKNKKNTYPTYRSSYLPIYSSKEKIYN